MDHILRDAVVKQVNAGRKKKINIETILHRVRRLDLGPLSDFAVNQRLLDILEQLVHEKRLRLPSQKNWDRITGLPRFVYAVRLEEDAARLKEKQLRDDLRHKTAWDPMLADVAPKLKTLKELTQAVAVNNYLRTRRADRSLLPHRERALRIFGDEKRLDRRTAQGGLFKGRITLKDLDCFYCPEPLPFQCFSLDQSDTAGKPLLVVENANTYWSCCKANHRLQTFAAVVYGKGSGIRSCEHACDGLLEIETQVAATGIVYFGDLDPTGITIPYQANQCRQARGLSPVRAADRLYLRLLRKNLTAPCTEAQQKGHDPNLARQWLGEELAAIYLKKAPLIRWPQEGLTTADMISDVSRKAAGEVP